MPEPSKPLSPHIGIYKSFGRPFLKVFLMGFCSYQVFYFTWVYMENQEMRVRKTGEIERLTRQLEDGKKERQI